VAITAEMRERANSPEAKEKRRATMAAKHAGTAAPPSVPPATQETTEGEHLPDQGNVLAEFADFARILGKAETKRQEKEAAIDGIEKLLGSLTPGDYPELADHPVVQKFMGLIAEKHERQDERKPGTVYGEGLARQDIPWRMEDVVKRATDPTHPDYETFRLVEWPGRETIYLGWNGLGIWVFEDHPQLIPKVFMDVYNESRRQKLAAQQHRDFLFAKRGLAGGPGPEGVAADPTIMAGPNGVASRMLRGQFSGGEFTPGGGLGVEVPEADRPGFSEIEEGEPAAA
jgi:hypothetical protein